MVFLVKIKKLAPKIIFVLAATILALIIIFNWQKILESLGKANWYYLPFAFIFSLFSYASSGYGFVLISRIFQIKEKAKRLFEIGFVTVIFNNLLSLGGLTAFSTRIFLINHHSEKKVPIRNILSASLFHSYLYTLSVPAILPFGFIYLLFHEGLTKQEIITLSSALILSLSFFIVVSLIIFHRKFRRKILEIINRLWQYFFKSQLKSYFESFDKTLHQGIIFFQNNPVFILATFTTIVADWVFALIALKLCFLALGLTTNASVLLIGYLLSVMVGTLSMIPGGLGIQESSMSGIYALFGLPLEITLIGSILFRIIFYFAPALISLAFYWRLLDRKK
jgi:hypothetical protein